MTHNRFHRSVEERDAALCATFGAFQAYPERIGGHVARSYDPRPARFYLAPSGAR